MTGLSNDKHRERTSRAQKRDRKDKAKGISMTLGSIAVIHSYFLDDSFITIIQTMILTMAVVFVLIMIIPSKLF